MGHNLHNILTKALALVLLCLTVTVLHVCCKLTIKEHVILKTRFAYILGNLETMTSTSSNEEETSYFAFRRIPYAEPPVGLLRWKDSVVKRPISYDLFLNATKDGNQCPQWVQSKSGSSLLIGDENCLFASVFIPVGRAGRASSPLKIMVYVHGGGFLVNADRGTVPIPLLEHENTIIIMFNYRVSIFGYLSTGSASLPGNYAFFDQITLLKWVQLYGGDFGGDTNDVTVFGSSIGSVSIHYLLLSRLSSGLFHKAIMESGSALCERSLVPNPLDISMKLGDMIGCPFYWEERYLVQCLRSKSMQELMMGAKQLTKKWSLPSVLGPVIDLTSRPPGHEFLPDFPENLEVINKVPVIVGITRNEGLNAFVKLSKEFGWEELHNLDIIQSVILPQYLDLIMRSRKLPVERSIYIERLSKQVMIQYMEEFGKDSIETLVGILGDIWINTCHRKSLEQFCGNGVPSVNAYLFTHHDAGISPSGIGKDIRFLEENGIEHPVLENGVGHTEEILYLLEKEENMEKSSRRNEEMSEHLSRIWSNFAVYGALGVNQGSLENGWPRWNPICWKKGGQSFYDPDYSLYEISLDNHRVFPNYRVKEIDFWWKIHEDTLLYR